MADKRLIENYDDPDAVDVAENKKDRILQAIQRGTPITCHHRKRGDREALLTKFVDPDTRHARYAVETWNGDTKHTVDYADHDTAVLELNKQCSVLHV